MHRTIIVFLATASFGFGSVPLLTFPASLHTQKISAAATDAAGNVYVTGTVSDIDSLFVKGVLIKNNFPATPGAFQTAYGSRLCLPPGGFYQGRSCMDAFVAKFSPAGQLIYASYLGGSGDEEGLAIAADSAGNAWVAGYTNSSDFPVTANALQKKNGGGSGSFTGHSPPAFQGDAFVTGVNATGTALIYSSFLGGTQPDVALAVALDPQGNVYLAGATGSEDFPVTSAPVPGQSTSGGFAAKLNPGKPAIIYSTYFDVPVTALAVDSAGAAYLAGTVSSTQHFVATPGAFQTVLSGTSNAFIAKLSPDAGSRVYATLLGGSISENGNSIAVDSAGAAWLTGYTYSPDFPVTLPPAAQRTGQAFVAHISADGSALLLAFALGQLSLSGQPLLIDPSGNLYVSGFLNAPLPVTPDALEKSSCKSDGPFITKWSPQGVLLYASYSREGAPAAIDSTGKLYIVQTGGTIFRFDPSADQRQSSLACVTNGASFRVYPVLPGGVAPGEIVSIFGDRLGPDEPAYFQLDTSGKVSTSVGNTRVLFDGIAAPMLYADANQINVIVPWGLAASNSVAVTVEYAGVSSIALNTGLYTIIPGVFQIEPSNTPAQGAILNQDGSLNSSANPAARGSIISIFCTGMGPLSPLPQDGEIIRDDSHLLQLQTAILFPGLTGYPPAQVTYAGAAPTMVAGVMQVNVRVPDTFSDAVTLPGPVPIYMQVPNGPVGNVLATVAVK